MANIFNGTQFGDLRFGDPGSMPTIPGATQPGQYGAFDQTGLVKQLQGNLKQDQASNQLAATRQAAAMGMGSSDANRAINQNIASTTQDRARALQMQAAKETWDSQLQQQQFQDTTNLARYKAEQEAWQMKMAASLAEQNQRKSNLGPFGIFLA